MNQILSIRDFSRPKVSRSWRCKYSDFSQRASQAALATTTINHWPRKLSAGTASPFKLVSGKSAGRSREGEIKSL